jgi:hypothetical protein
LSFLRLIELKKGLIKRQFFFLSVRKIFQSWAYEVPEKKIICYQLITVIMLSDTCYQLIRSFQPITCYQVITCYRLIVLLLKTFFLFPGNFRHSSKMQKPTSPTVQWRLMKKRRPQLMRVFSCFHIFLTRKLGFLHYWNITLFRLLMTCL